MRIKTIKWEELKSGPGYENRRCGVEIELSVGESPSAVLEDAKKFVHAALHDQTKGYATHDELEKIEADARALADKIASSRIPF